MDASNVKEDFCPLCRTIMKNSVEDHVETDRHKYNTLVLHSLNNRGEYARNKSGLRLRVNSLYNRNSRLSYFEDCGKYVLDVFDVDLSKFGTVFEFMCFFSNRTDKSMMITHGSVLDGPGFMYDVKDNGWLESDSRVCIKPGSLYSNVRIAIDIKEAICGKYTIPFAFNVEKAGKNIFISRTIIIAINGSEEWTFRLPRESTSRASNQTKRCEWINSNIVKPTKIRSCYTKYQIDAKLVDYLKAMENNSNKTENEDMRRMRQMMEGGLTMKNYRQFFQNCLWAEEETMPYGVKFLSLEKVSAKIVHGELLVFPIYNLADQRVDLAAGNLIRVRLHKGTEIYEGYILGKRWGWLEVHHINTRFLDSLRSSSGKWIDVQFQLGRIPMERNHRGLERVVKKQFVPYLFPDRLKYGEYVRTYDLTADDFVNRRIAENPEQKTAVINILNRSSQGAPYIVFGPPGTGKTDTIVEAICQILKKTDKKVLVCASANAHCDMLAIKLSKYCRPDEMCRAYSSSRNANWVPHQVRRYVNMSERRIEKMSSSHLQRYRIIITTLIFIGKFNEESYTPDYVFIDEAAQATEPQVCIPFSRMRKGGCLVLAGDPKQLKPLIKSEQARKFGLDISLMQRLVETQRIYQNGDARFITTLRTSYRCHPALLKMTSELFYDSKLTFQADPTTTDPISKINIFPHVSNPNGERHSEEGSGEALEFCAVSSGEMREGLSPSFFNLDEALMIVKYVTSLLKVPVQPEIAKQDIGVITPYNKQVNKIKDLLKRCRFEEIDVGTIESFQGKEKRIILMSTVRGQFDLLKFDNQYGLGFLKQPERFNVAITRAKSKLVVVGCPLVLNTDNYWRTFIRTCQQFKTYFGMGSTSRDYSKVLEGFARFPQLDAELKNADPLIREKEEDTESGSYFSAVSEEIDNEEMEDEEVHDGEVEVAEVPDAEIPDAEIHHAEIHHAEIHHAEIHHAEIHHAEIHDAELDNVEMHMMQVHDGEANELEIYDENIQNMVEYRGDILDEEIYVEEMHNGDFLHEDIYEEDIQHVQFNEEEIHEREVHNEEVHGVQILYDGEIQNVQDHDEENQNVVYDEESTDEEVDQADILFAEIPDANIHDPFHNIDTHGIHDAELHDSVCHDEEVQNEENHHEEIQEEEIYERDIQNVELNVGEIHEGEIHEGENVRNRGEENQNEVIHHGEVYDEAINAGEIQSEGALEEEINDEKVHDDEIQYGEVHDEEILGEDSQNEVVHEEGVHGGEVHDEVIQDINNEKVHDDEIQYGEVEILGEDSQNEVVHEGDVHDEVLDEVIQNEVVHNEDIQNEMVHDKEIQHEEVRERELYDEEVHGVDVQNEEVHNEEIQNENVRDNEIQPEEVGEEEIRVKEVRDEEVHGVGVQNEEVRNETIQNEKVRDNEIRHVEVDEEKVREREVRDEEVHGVGVQNEEAHHEDIQNEKDRENEIQPEEVGEEEIRVKEVRDEEVHGVGVQNEEVHNETIQNEKVRDNEIRHVEVDEEKVREREVRDEEVHGVGVQNEEAHHEDIQNEKDRENEIQPEEVGEEEIRVKEVRDEEVHGVGVQNEEVHNETIQNEKVRDNEIRHVEVDEEKVREREVRDEEVHGVGVQNDEAHHEDIQNEKVRNNEIQPEEVGEEEVRVKEVRDEEVHDVGVQNEEVHNEAIQNEKVRDNEIRHVEVDEENVREREVHDDEVHNVGVKNEEDREIENEESNEDRGKEGASSTSSSDVETDRTSTTGSSSTTSEFEIVEIMSSDFEMIDSDELD